MKDQVKPKGKKIIKPIFRDSISFIYITNKKLLLFNWKFEY